MREDFREFARPAQISIAAPAFVYLFAAIWAVPYGRPEVTLGLVAIFAAAAAVKPIPYPLGGIKVPNVGLIIVAALLWRPGEVLLGVGVGTFIGLLLFRKNEVWRSALNMHMWGLPASAAAVVAHSAISRIPPGLAQLAIAALLAVATHRVINMGLFAWYRSTRFNLPFLADWFQHITSEGVSQILSAPLAVALAAVADRTGSVFSGLGLTALAALGLPLARQELSHYTRSQLMLDEIVEAVVRALEGVDPNARAHGDRVSAIAAETGRRLGMSERALLALRLASRLHEVGLLAGSHDSNDEQRAVVGGRILAQFPDPMIAEIVRSHRERWDGEGVPDHKRGKAIVLGARILTVSDLYESALEGLSPFKTAFSRQAAANQLIALIGTVLDPQVAMVLLQVANERHMDHAASG